MLLEDFQNHYTAVHLLERSLEKGRLGHAYLFTGDKIRLLESFAQLFALALFCSEKDQNSLESCRSCPSCSKIISGNHPDFHQLRPESKLRQIRMEPTQNLIRTLQSKAFDGGYKVGVISGMDRMNVQAANAFLKTLEEPPDKTIFMLLSTEPEQLLDTITSRCLKLHFPSSGEVSFSPDLQSLISGLATHLCQCKPNDILTKYKMLGDFMYALKELSNQIQEAVEERAYSSESNAQLEGNLKEKFETELKASIEAEYRLRRSEFILAIEWFFRDVWILQNNIPEIQPVFPQLSKWTSMLAQKLQTNHVLENMQHLETLQSQLKTNAQEALALEVCFLKLHVQS